MRLKWILILLVLYLSGCKTTVTVFMAKDWHVDAYSPLQTKIELGLERDN